MKKADTLKTEVCGERGALQEWRAALERNADDISAIEQFTKQDISKAKVIFCYILNRKTYLRTFLKFSYNGIVWIIHTLYTLTYWLLL